MNLRKKKELAAKVFGVGKRKIWFDSSRLSEIKEAITKQDIKDLNASGAILIKQDKGRRKVVKRKTKKGPGKIKMTIQHRKQEYVKLTRKLRNYLKELRKQGKIKNEDFWDLRKKIKMRNFKSKAHLKEIISGLVMTKTENKDVNAKKTKSKKSRGEGKK
jgi:large subunit ribosomal protein L19e